MTKTICIIGGGASGFFAAIHAQQSSPKATVILLEKNKDVLAKVKISGGGRCNVTHACFDPQDLVEFYPRGSKALRSVFSRFQPGDTMDWFESHGVPLKIESDNRIFPTSDSSQSIIDALLNTARELGIKILTKRTVTSIKKNNSQFTLTLKDQDPITCDALILSTGSSPAGYEFATSLGHTIVPLVPSLFTFTIKDKALTQLSGLSMSEVTASLPEFEPDTTPQSGPLLVTHWGLSGPGIIKLSAWAARHFHAAKYTTQLCLNHLPQHSPDSVLTHLEHTATQHPDKQIQSFCPFSKIPSRYWHYLLSKTNLDPTSKWKQLSPKDFTTLVARLTEFKLQIVGKGVFKDEFVTAGGVELDEVNFKTMESKVCEGLYLTGELLNIDGVTGGFNFQNAWSTGYIAGNNAGKTVR
jgi:predicted Rossmann fold flavoprotein